MAGPPAPVAAVRVAVRRMLAGSDAPEAGDLVLVALSGGADSLALLTAAAFEAPRCGYRVGAVIVDHGWTPDSADRTAAVAAVARALGADPVDVVAVQCDRTEDDARRARYAALDAAADRLGATRVLLGHSLDDQAETVLMGLARGSGARSLAGMRARRGRYLRPFLDLRRDTLRAAVIAAGLEPWDDPANGDPAFARSRVRHDVLPLLDAALGPGVVEALGRTADLLAADAEALDQWSAEVDPGGLEVTVEQLSQLPAAVRRRVLRTIALRAGAPPSALTSGHIVAIDALVTDWHGQGAVALPGSLCAVRACGRLTVRSAQESSEPPT
jgi:tRNA(Ile)-lysidine synthase